MAANINGTNIPANMATSGRYLFNPPEILGRNGQGAIVQGDYSSITWTFPLMLNSDFAWWYTTLLGGNPSLLITSASLSNTLGVLTSFTHGVVLRPTYEFAKAVLYNNVTIKIEDLA